MSITDSLFLLKTACVCVTDSMCPSQTVCHKNSVSLRTVCAHYSQFVSVAESLCLSQKFVSVTDSLGMYQRLILMIFTNSAPLGRVGLVVAISICMCFGMLSPPMLFFSRPLIGPQITLSVPGLSLVNPAP